MVVPILATPYLPFRYAPEHAAVMATLAHWRDPAFSAPYAPAILHSPYLLYHLTGGALTSLVRDAELANRLLLAATAIALPLSFRALLRAASRDERLAIFACLPFWSRPLVLGFLPFVASLPIALYALALFLRQARSRPDRRRQQRGLRERPTWLAAVALLLFYAHVSTWMVLVAAATAIALVARRVRLLLALVPSAAAAGMWLAFGRITRGEGTLADSTEIARTSVTRSLLLMPRWIFDVWRGHGDELAAGLWWIGFGAVALSSRAVARYSRRALVLLYAPFASALAVYLLTPWRLGAGVMLNVRLAPILVLLAFLPTRLPRRSVLAAVALGLAFVANIAGGVTAMRECRAARSDLGDLEAVLAAMPPGARLITLNFDIRSDTTHIFPWAHVGAYHRVRSGGVASFSFSELHHWPLHYASAARPPAKDGATWDVDPCSFRNATDGAYYDFVLVRGDVDPFRSEPAGPVYRRALSAGRMTLYRKEGGAWPETGSPDLGPCSDRR